MMAADDGGKMAALAEIVGSHFIQLANGVAALVFSCVIISLVGSRQTTIELHQSTQIDDVTHSLLLAIITDQWWLGGVVVRALDS